MGRKRGVLCELPAPSYDPGPCTATSTQECPFFGLDDHWHQDGVGSQTCAVGWAPPEPITAPNLPNLPALPRRRIAPVAVPPLPEPDLELISSLFGDLPAQDDVEGWGGFVRGVEAAQRRLAALAMRGAVGVRTALGIAEDKAQVPAAARLEDLASACLAVEVQCTEHAAETRLWEAQQIVDRLPETWALLHAGQVSLAVARVVAELTANLSDHLLSDAEGNLWPAHTGRTSSQVRRALRRIIARLDADALKKEAADARAARRVEIGPDPVEGGTAITLRGDHATQHQLWADARLLAGPDRPGDERTLDQRTYDAVVGAVGQAADVLRARFLPAVAAQLALAAAVDEPRSSNAPSAGAGDPAGLSPAVLRRWQARCAVQVTISDAALLGITDEPATMRTLGARDAQLPAADARRMVTQSIRAGMSVDQLILSVTSGAVVDLRRRGLHPPRPRGPSRRADGTGPDPYRPGAHLRRLIAARDPGCPEPVCTRSSRTADHDHHEPHGRGGATEAANLGPPCRHHHRLKQHPLIGMRTVLTSEDLPVRVWTFPTGTSVPTRPPDLRE